METPASSSRANFKEGGWCCLQSPEQSLGFVVLGRNVGGQLPVILRDRSSHLSGQGNPLQEHQPGGKQLLHPQETLAPHPARSQQHRTRNRSLSRLWVSVTGSEVRLYAHFFCEPEWYFPIIGGPALGRPDLWASEAHVPEH